MIVQILAALAIPFLLLAAMTDISVRAVPNLVCVVLALDGVAMACVGHCLTASLLAMFCVFVPAVICWRHGLLGGGDAKLLAAVTLLVPANSAPILLLMIAIAGGVLALVYATMRLIKLSDRPAGRQTFGRIFRAERYRIRRGFSLPYAVAISSGTLLAISHRFSL